MKHSWCALLLGNGQSEAEEAVEGLSRASPDAWARHDRRELAKIMAEDADS